MVVTVETHFVTRQTVVNIVYSLRQSDIHLQGCNIVTVFKTNSHRLFLTRLYDNVIYRNLVIGLRKSKSADGHETCHKQSRHKVVV